MMEREHDIDCWPDMSTDIHDTREQCAYCNRNAPTQPPHPTMPPSTPFEAVFSIFFTYGGRYYLLVGDCLSGWVEVFGSPGGTAGLIRHHCSFFAQIWCSGKTFQ